MSPRAMPEKRDGNGARRVKRFGDRTAVAAGCLLAVACSRWSASHPAPFAAARPATSPDALRAFLEARRDPAIDPNPRIKPRDVLHVEAKDLAEFAKDYTVSPSGTVNFPILGRLRVAGKATKELESELAKRLESVVVKPEVKVDVVESSGRTVLVLGAVERPGTVSLGPRGKTLVEVLALAGGLSEEAGTVIRVIPSGAAEPGLFADAADASADAVEIAAVDLLRSGENGGLRAYLWPGDLVDVPSRPGASPGESRLAVPAPRAETAKSEAPTPAVEPKASEARLAELRNPRQRDEAGNQRENAELQSRIAGAEGRLERDREAREEDVAAAKRPRVEKETLDDANRELTRARAEALEERAKLAPEHDRPAEKRTTLEASREDEIAALRLRMTELENDLAREREQRERSFAEAERLARENQKLREENDKLATARQGALQERERLLQERAEILERRQAIEAVSRQEVGALQAQIRDVETALAREQEQRAESVEAADRLRTEKRSLERENVRLAEAAKDAPAKEIELAGEKRAVAASEGEVASLRARLNELEARLGEERRERERGFDEANRLQEERRKLEVERVRLVTEQQEEIRARELAGRERAEEAERLSRDRPAAAAPRDAAKAASAAPPAATPPESPPILVPAERRALAGQSRRASTPALAAAAPSPARVPPAASKGPPVLPPALASGPAAPAAATAAASTSPEPARAAAEAPPSAPVAARAGSATVSVIGLVAKPGSYGADQVKTVSQAVATAGKRAGADLKQVELQHRAPSGALVRTLVDVDAVHAGLRSDEPVAPGDTVIVPGVLW